MADAPERRSTQGRPAAKPPAAAPAGKPAARPATAAGAKPAAAPAGKPVARPATPGGTRKPPAPPGGEGGVAPTMIVSKRDTAAGKRASGGQAAAPAPAAEPPAAAAAESRRSSGRRKRGDKSDTVETGPAARGGPRRGGGGFLKPEGLGLAAKFALVTAATILVLMSIFSVIVYNVSATAIDQQIDDDGVIMVNLLAKLAEEYYVLQQVEEIRTQWREVKEKKDKGEALPDDWRERQAQYKSAMDSLKTRYDQHMHELQHFRLAEGGGSQTPFLRVLAVAIVGQGKGDTKAAILVSGDFKGYSVPLYVWKVDGADTDIESGRGEMRDGRPVALFKKPVYDQWTGGKRALPWEAHVFLNAAEIEGAKGRLGMYIFLFLLLIVSGGAGTVFIAATRVTKPVQELISDIDTVSKGDLEHRTLARSKDEIGVLAKAFNAMTESLLVAREKEVENQARAHELNIATEIQANLLPKKIPRLPGLDIDAFYQPSKEVGGDYYDFIPIDDNHLGMIVADVSGKGIPGSMVMTMARALIRMEALRNLSPADTFSKANRMIAADIRRGMFVTAIYGVLDVPNRTFLVASAGHNPMVVWRKESNAIQLVNPNGIALGFDRGPIFERTIKEQMIKLNPGDRIVLYTDGIPESMNANHEEFGDKRFYQLCQKVASRNSSQFTNIVVAKVKEHQGDSEQHDDITILTLAVE